MKYLLLVITCFLLAINNCYAESDLLNNTSPTLQDTILSKLLRIKVTKFAHWRSLSITHDSISVDAFTAFNKRNSLSNKNLKIGSLLYVTSWIGILILSNNDNGPKWIENSIGVSLVSANLTGLMYLIPCGLVKKYLAISTREHRLASKYYNKYNWVIDK